MQEGSDSHHNYKLTVVNSPLSRQLLPADGSLKTFALAAIHRLAAVRRERNLGVGAALDTSSWIQAPAGDAAAVSAVHSTHPILGRAACCTTLWRVGKTLAGEERLLTGTEGKTASAVDTFQFLICQTQGETSFLYDCSEHRSSGILKTFALKRPL